MMLILWAAGRQPGYAGQFHQEKFSIPQISTGDMLRAAVIPGGTAGPSRRRR